MKIVKQIDEKHFLGEEDGEKVLLVKKFFTSKKIKDEYENKRCILIYGNI